MKNECTHVVLLPGTGTDILKKVMTESGYTNDFYTEVHSLKDGVSVALEKAPPGEVVLFSPGFASFGLFKNEYERNDEFMKIFHSLQNEEVV